MSIDDLTTEVMNKLVQKAHEIYMSDPEGNDECTILYDLMEDMMVEDEE